jgi:hypothetical protein
VHAKARGATIKKKKKKEKKNKRKREAIEYAVDGSHACQVNAEEASDT